MANVTFDLLWRECMRELLDLLELEQPPEDFGSWKEDQVISHFSYLYIRYVLLYTSLEDCMDQHVHAQKRKDIQAAIDSVMVTQHPMFLHPYVSHAIAGPHARGESAANVGIRQRLRQFR
jgi:hypothetical protein